MRPVDSAKTHGARLARGINLTTLQIESVQSTGSHTDGIHFGMSRRVLVYGNTIGGLSHDNTILGNDGSERTTTMAHAVL